MDSLEEQSLDYQWERLLDRIAEMVGKRPTDLNGVLFLIGVQELGKGALHFTKEQKQDLMHIGICKVLSLSNYYELEGHDQDGWPHFKLINPLPFTDLLTQEKLLKIHVLEFFKKL